MNTANLQLEGLLLAVAGILDALAAKGVLSSPEIEAALKSAEDAALREAKTRNIGAAQVEAVRFPIRFLLAGIADTSGQLPTFADITTAVGEAKRTR